MGRSAKFAAGAALGGMMVTAALLAGQTPDKGIAEARGAPSPRPERSRQELERCRTITFADSACEAAWEAQRRHFFASDRERRQER